MRIRESVCVSKRTDCGAIANLLKTRNPIVRDEVYFLGVLDKQLFVE